MQLHPGHPSHTGPRGDTTGVWGACSAPAEAPWVWGAGGDLAGARWNLQRWDQARPQPRNETTTALPKNGGQSLSLLFPWGPILQAPIISLIIHSCCLPWPKPGFAVTTGHQEWLQPRAGAAAVPRAPFLPLGVTHRDPGMCWSQSRAVGTARVGWRGAPGQPPRAAAGTALGFLSCLPSPVWGLPLTFGFLHHWINVCSSLETKTLSSSQGGGRGRPWGHRAGRDSCDSALQAALCSHTKKDHLKKAQKTTH